MNGAASGPAPGTGPELETRAVTGLPERSGATLDARLKVRLGQLDLDVALEAPAGRTVAILGPNGAGKTTILRVLAGLQALDAGHVDLDGRRLDESATRTWVPTEDRKVGFVHQDLLLFPHLSARENVAFGLRAQGMAKDGARRRAQAWLEQVGLADQADARPHALSGGQAQRVALARALAVEPAMLLLDEPLAALDAGTRPETRRDLRRFLDSFSGVSVLVTHDPLDALLLAHDVVVLEAGRVTQAGPIAEVTARPRTRYVADLVGINLLRGFATDRAVRVGSASIAIAERADGDTFAAIAPQAVVLSRSKPDGSARNGWPVRVTTVDLLGDRVRIGLAGDLVLTAEITPPALASLGLRPGDQVWASVKATEVHTYLA